MPPTYGYTRPMVTVVLARGCDMRGCRLSFRALKGPIAEQRYAGSRTCQATRLPQFICRLRLSNAVADDVEYIDQVEFLHSSPLLRASRFTALVCAATQNRLIFGIITNNNPSATNPPPRKPFAYETALEAL